MDIDPQEDIAVIGPFVGGQEFLYPPEYFSRPAVGAELEDTSKDFVMMQIDVDYYICRNEEGEEFPTIRIFGVNDAGNSIMLHVHSFRPYFYIEPPAGFSDDPETLNRLKAELSDKGKALRAIGGKKQKPISEIEVVEKEAIRGYKGSTEIKRTFLKVYTTLPTYVASYRGIIEKGFIFEENEFSNMVYEANMPFTLRFMIDIGMMGLSWLKLKGNAYKIRAKEKRISVSQLEIDVNYSDIVPMKAEGEFLRIAPLRILSFDIECAPEKGFPSAERDPVIQIASICKCHNSDKNIVRTVFTLKKCSNMVDADVRCFEKEEDLLDEWQKFLIQLDPDILTGFNIQNFDLPYILRRGANLNVKDFGYFGRILKSETRIKDGKFLSKAMGMRDTKELNIEGRTLMDMYIHMLKDFKLSSYSLNNVSFHFLREQKEDVHYSILYALQNSTPDTRRRIAVYCLKDAYLPLKLMEKLMCVYNYGEMARVTGVPLNYLFNRGQQIKVASQLYRFAAIYDIIIPTERAHYSEGKYEGAYVLEPKTGYINSPVATLDFASLYPSIMMAHNLCYTTLIPPDLVPKIDKQDYTRSPRGDCFIKPHIRKGLLPMILEDLINARKKAKLELQKETDPFKRAVLDGRQLALKISANSVYGFTGAQVGQLPCLQVSASVTAFGREMIEKTRQLVTENFSTRNGFKYDSDVIYGDTDSVMVNFGVDSVEEAMRLGKEAAETITKHFISPIKLEFEKVYFPYLLMSKKRYAGLLWTNPNNYDKIDTKGIENVRRDNCTLIRLMIEEILNMILVQRDIEKADKYVKDIVSELLQNKIDLSLLVITKAITKNYDEFDPLDEIKAKNSYKAKQAHVELAGRIKKRDAGSAPSIGDRIAYVMITGTKGSKNYENAEDPIYVLDHDLPIDFDYYIEKQLKPPITRIFEHIIPNPNQLFSGDHTKHVYMPKLTNKTTGLGKFATVKSTCLNCKGPLKNGEKAGNGKVEALCNHCEGKTMEIYTQKLLEVRNLQQSYSELWTMCQRCQESLHQEVLCSNRDCPIFYRRKKVQKEIGVAQGILDRFENECTSILFMLFALVLNEICLSLANKLKSNERTKKYFRYVQNSALTTCIGLLCGIILKYSSLQGVMGTIKEGFSEFFLIILLPPILLESFLKLTKSDQH